MAKRFPADYEFSAEYPVTRDMCTDHVPGVPPILATPSMIHLVEVTGFQAMSPKFREGETSVGAAVSISHLAPTPVDDKITINIRLLAEEGRKLVWDFKVLDSRGPVAEGRHERFLIDIEEFKAGLKKRLS